MSIATDASIKSPEAQRHLEYARDPTFTYEMARVFGNDEPAPAERVFYDMSLRGTPVQAYYSNPQEVIDMYPEYQKPLVREHMRRQFGTTKPVMGLNPDIIGADIRYTHSVIDHEKSHGAQPKGKLALKSVHASTRYGTIPLGEMLIEGWTEYGLEKKRKPPSRYFDEMHGHGKAAYSKYRDMVYEIEERSPGLTRQVMRAARRGGPDAAIRLLEEAKIGDVVEKYAAKLAPRSYSKAA